MKQRHFRLIDLVHKSTDGRRHLLKANEIHSVRFIIICGLAKRNMAVMVYDLVENTISPFYVFLNYCGPPCGEKKQQKCCQPNCLM